MQNMPSAHISGIEEGSPADRAGFRPGYSIYSVNGIPLRDYIDWLWLTDGDSIAIEGEDEAGNHINVHLSRDIDGFENWGITFSEVVFDEVKQCKNACTFCFERQLPREARGALTMRDDDYRLSFLQGTYVTLSNLGEDEISRIIEQGISPLRVSLHAVDPEVRRQLIGKNASVGMSNLEKLLEAGIDFDAQIVLVPGVNDGSVLDETLEWAYEQAGIQNVAVVPLGFTKHQSMFDKSYGHPSDSKAIIDRLKPFQERAFKERGEVWVYAADEFYRDAFGPNLLEELPQSEFYGEFGMFEDGIGIIRSMVDSFEEAKALGLDEECAIALRSASFTAGLISGEAMRPYANELVERTALSGLLDMVIIENDYFGGNVNVTGLLSGNDISNGIASNFSEWQASHLQSDPGKRMYLIMDIVFNADGVTLDDMTIEDIRASIAEQTTGLDVENVCIVPTNPIDYIQSITKISNKLSR